MVSEREIKIGEIMTNGQQGPEHERGVEQEQTSDHKAIRGAGLEGDINIEEKYPSDPHELYRNLIKHNRSWKNNEDFEEEVEDFGSWFRATLAYISVGESESALVALEKTDLSLDHKCEMMSFCYREACQLIDRIHIKTGNVGKPLSKEDESRKETYQKYSEILGTKKDTE